MKRNIEHYIVTKHQSIGISLQTKKNMLKQFLPEHSEFLYYLAGTQRLGLHRLFQSSSQPEPPTQTSRPALEHQINSKQLFNRIAGFTSRYWKEISFYV